MTAAGEPPAVGSSAGEPPAGDGRPVLLLLTGDLFLGSRLRGFAEAAGYAVRSGVSAGALDTPGEPPPDRVVVDLTAPRVDLGELRARLGPSMPDRAAAYAPHVRVDLLRAARAAGLTAVFTRSQLETELPRWLGHGAGSHEAI